LSGELDKLAQLAKRIEANVSPLGFPTESRAFTPHLTLARVGDRVLPNERQKLGQLIASTKFEAKSAIEVKAINLMKSQLTPQGAIYSRLHSVELKS
jgi:2'-5' RNA ligase